MGQLCESCGQSLPHDGAVSVGASNDAADGDSEVVWLGSPGSSEASHPFAKPQGSVASRKEKRVLFGVLAVVFAWAAFVGIGRLTSPDSAIDDAAAAAIEDRSAENADEAVVGEADRVDDPPALADNSDGEPGIAPPALAERLDGDYSAADAAPGFPVQVPEADAFEDHGGLGRSQRDDFVDGSNLGARTGLNPQVERLVGEFNRRDSNVFVAYRSASGVVLVDLAQGLADEIEVGFASLTPLPGAHVLRSGPFSFGIDPDTLDIEQIGDDASLVVTRSRDGATYVVPAAERVGELAVLEVMANGAASTIEVPVDGLQPLPIDGLGMLAVPNATTGETLIAGIEGFEVLSPNRVLAGTSTAVLEQVCTSPAACTLELFDLATGERTTLPESFARFGDSYTVSPDGGALLRRSPQGFAEMFIVDSNTQAVVVRAGIQEAAWGPNSDFVVWLDEIGVPELKVIFADGGDPLAVELSALGAPAPISPELIVFSFDPVTGVGRPGF